MLTLNETHIRRVSLTHTFCLVSPARLNNDIHTSFVVRLPSRPSGTEITGMAHQLGYEREVIRIWFCNKRQALKNTVRMMSKGMV